MTKLTVADWICYGICVEFLALVIFDVYLAMSKQELISTAATSINKSTGWLIAGVYFLMGFHFFFLQYIVALYHKFMSFRW